jgi:hypothetical protein
MPAAEKASEKAANASHKKVNPQPTAKVKDAEQENLELRRKIASLEKRLSGGAGAKEFLIESPILRDEAAWAELNKGSNARLLRSFMMPSYLQIHAQPLPEARTGRVKHIRGGAVELIGGRGEFDSEDWARYLSLNYPDYIISQRQSDGSYKRFTVVLPAQASAAVPRRRVLLRRTPADGPDPGGLQPERHGYPGGSGPGQPGRPGPGPYPAYQTPGSNAAGS